MRKLLGAVLWPARLFWRATMTRNFKYGTPFWLSEPEVVDGRTIRSEGVTMRIRGLSEGAASAAGALTANLRWRKLWIIPSGRADDGTLLVDIHCGRGDIARNMIRQGHK